LREQPQDLVCLVGGVGNVSCRGNSPHITAQKHDRRMEEGAGNANILELTAQGICSDKVGS